MSRSCRGSRRGSATAARARLTAPLAHWETRRMHTIRQHRTYPKIATARQTRTGCVMARRSSLTSQLYKLAPLSASGGAVRKGYAGRRVNNIILDRALGLAGVSRRLWR